MIMIMMCGNKNGNTCNDDKNTDITITIHDDKNTDIICMYDNI